MTITNRVLLGTVVLLLGVAAFAWWYEQAQRAAAEQAKIYEAVARLRTVWVMRKKIVDDIGPSVASIEEYVGTLPSADRVFMVSRASEYYIGLGCRRRNEERRWQLLHAGNTFGAATRALQTGDPKSGPTADDLRQALSGIDSYMKWEECTPPDPEAVKELNGISLKEAQMARRQCRPLGDAVAVAKCEASKGARLHKIEAHVARGDDSD
jgi:hypothetical protein